MTQIGHKFWNKKHKLSKHLNLNQENAKSKRNRILNKPSTCERISADLGESGSEKGFSDNTSSRVTQGHLVGTMNPATAATVKLSW
jgi:hypothetical protein